MTQAPLCLPEILLVRPQSGANVGLVVRLCSNYALPAPRIVSPEPGWERDAARTAAMCRELLSQCRLYETLEQAGAELHELVGFSARTGKDRWADDLSWLGGLVREWDAETRVGLVFGNERTGLDESEIAACTRLLRAELPGLSSFNLSHAVATALHEWHRREEPKPPKPSQRSTTLDERERLVAHARETLTRIGYRVEDPHFEGALQRILRSQALQSRDARIVHKVLKHLDVLHPPGS